MPADMGHNLGDHVEGYKETLARFKADADKYAEVTEDNAQFIRDHIGYGNKLAKEIDSTRDELKRPHLEAGRKIDGAYKPLIETCDDIVKAMKRKLAAFLDAREREAKRIAEEAKRKLEEAERLAAKAAEEPEEDAFLAATAPTVDLVAAHVEAKVAEGQAFAASRVSSAAGGFAATSLRTKRSAKVTDWSALAAHYLNRGEVRAVLEQLANSDIRHSKGAEIDIPGVEIVTERVL
jgi:DNA repair exonuclease SbcCD ATPase subunit